MAKNPKCVEAGRRGGIATRDRYGSEYYRELGKNSGGGRPSRAEELARHGIAGNTRRNKRR